MTLHPSLVDLPPMAVAGRLDRLRAKLDPAGCDAVLITHLVNIRYLTGFTGSAALLLVLPDETVFVSDGRYGEQAAAQLGASGVAARIEISGTEQRKAIMGAVAAAEGAVTRIGLEADDVTWSAQRSYAGEWFPAHEVVATEGLVADLRLHKDDGEIARIAAAAAIADDALSRTRAQLADGLTEAEFGLLLDTEIRRLGASGTSFETIVAAGPNGAMPHHRPGQRIIANGDLVVIDFGALVDGYCSDMTRTVMLGEPTPTQERMLAVVAQAQQAGVDAVGPGVEAKAVDAACRTVIGDAGWADAFLHGTGHGVGLDIHEAPRVGSTSTAVLAEGQIVTVEPGVYLPEHGGVRIEDTVVVTADGCRALTMAPKDPVLAVSG